MKKLALLMALAISCVSASAVEIFDEDFSGYADGGIDGVSAWVAALDGGFSETTNGVLRLDPFGNRVMFTNGTAVAFGERVQITVDYWVRANTVRTHSSFLTVGVQNNGTNALVFNDSLVDNYMFMFGYEPYRQSGDFYFMPDRQRWTDGSFNTFGEPDLGINPFGYYTDVEPYDDPAYIDSDSDDLRMIYTITKSHVSNQFNVAVSISNLTTGLFYDEGSLAGIERPSVWASSNLYFSMGSLGEGNTNFIQSVKMELLDALIVPPSSISAIGLDSEVQLSWSVVPGSTQYDVYRTTVQGDYTGVIPVTVSTESYTDTSVVNGTTYYYSIASKLTGGDSGLSAETEVTPAKIFASEAVINTDFSGHTLGADLASTADWGAVSSSAPNAFTIAQNAALNQVAATQQTTNTFDATVGHAVYLESAIQNETDDVIEGYVDVVMSVTADAGMDSDHGNQGLMSFGITSSKTESHLTSKPEMALFHLTVRYENSMYVLFGEDLINTELNNLAGLDYAGLGWNPKPAEAATAPWLGDNALPQDLETDTIRIFWKIRKTREGGIYKAWASMSNLTTAAASTGDIEFATQPKQEMYDAPFALFTMGHYYRAYLDDGSFSILNAEVNEVDVNHSGKEVPTAAAPVITSVVAGDRFVHFEWDSILEATGFDVYLSTEGENYTLAMDAPLLSYTDTPRWNGVTNTYTIRARFDADVTPNFMDSAPVVGVPQPFLDLVKWDGGRQDLIFGGTSFAFDQSGLQTNATRVYVDAMTTPFVSSGAMDGDVFYASYTLYGLIQRLGSDFGSDWRIDTDDDAHRYFTGGGWLTSFDTLTYIEVIDMDWEGAPEASIDLNARPLNATYETMNYTDNSDEGWLTFHAAIRNGSQWYVSHPDEYRGPDTSGQVYLHPDFMSTSWKPFNPTPGNDFSFGSVIPDNTILTNINAVGWVVDNTGWTGIRRFELQTLRDVTSYDSWASNIGLYGSDADEDADPDGDLLTNKKEYAFGGHPYNPYDQGTLPVFDSASYLGTNGFTFVHIQSRDPFSGLAYDVETTENLTNTTWTTINSVIIGETIFDYYWKSVTNFVPADVDTRFIRLNL